MSKETVFKEEARDGLKRGVDLIADAVKSTLGPRGRNVVYGFPYGSPIATKDGVTVARQIEATNQLEQLGVLLVRDVAQKTADDCGDGTTTASVLAQSIFTEGIKSLNTGSNPILIKKGIDKAVDEIVAFIEKNSKPISGEDATLDVATLSANNDRDIGKLIADAISHVGDKGVVTIEDNMANNVSEVVTIEGMQLSEGMISPFFMTDTDKMTAQYTNPKILLVDGAIDDIVPFVPVIEDCIKNHKRPLVIIAHDVIGTALQSVVASKAQQGIPLLVCKASQFGDYRSDLLSDIALLIGGMVVGGKIGIMTKDLTYDMLGECESVKADRFTTTIIGGKGDVTARVEMLDREIEAAVSDYDKEKLQERIAKLTTGVAVIKVGGQSDVEQKEKKARVEDSLFATKAAIDSGIVSGGGTMYLKGSRELSEGSNLYEEEKIGYSIIRKALRAPICQIASNSGISGEEVIAKICSNGNSLSYGYDFLNNKYGDLYEFGVIDPAKVVINALRNASSIAGTMLTTEVAIYETEDETYTRTPRGRSE
jgi:chaperonin GroEL